MSEWLLLPFCYPSFAQTLTVTLGRSHLLKSHRCVSDSCTHSLLLVHLANMYRVWNVTFHIKTDKRGPCDPLYRMEPLACGSVGDADPFSDAFGRALTNVEDSLPLRSSHYEQASSVTSDTSDIFSLRSSIQDSPFTPNTTHSFFSQPDDCGPVATQLPYHPIPPKLDCHAAKIDPLTHSPTSTEGFYLLQSTIGDLTAKIEGQDDNPSPQLAPPSVITPPAPRSKARLSINTQQYVKPSAKRKRTKKAPFSMRRRPPVKSREQHLADNKAAAAKCRQQRRTWETHLQDVSGVLKASIDASKSEINELGNEVVTLKRQLWACPDCTDRYVYSRGLESNGIPPDGKGAGSPFARPDKLLT